MPLQHFDISRDDAWYHAFPDVALTSTGRLVCVFTECTHHGDRSHSHMMYTWSDDRGRTWAPKKPMQFHGLAKGCDCARVFTLRDGTLMALCPTDFLFEDVNGVALFTSEDDGETWSPPRLTPVHHPMPDRILELSTGRWLLSAQRRSPYPPMKHEEGVVYYSDDRGYSWVGPIVYASQPGLWLCEGSLMELPDGTVAAVLRENSGEGFDAYKTLSKDGGLTWGPLHRMPIPACHRPVCGMLQSGKVLITYRHMQGGKGWVGYWTQNSMAALTDVESMLAQERREQWARIMPLNFDRSPASDTGYTGWAQFPDGEIYVVYYCLDDAPKGQIRGCSFHESDMVLPAPQA